MKTKSPLHRIAALFALALLALFAAPHANAQTLATLSSSNYTQNFNSMGTSSTAALPTGWFTTTDATSFTGTTNTTVAYGTTGTGVVTGTSGGGIVNWASGVTGSSTDRALGILNTGSFTTGKSIVFGFTNTTGSSVTNLSLAWDYEKYRSGTRAWAWTFAYSTDGSTWITNDSGGHSYAADANNTTVNNPPTTNSKSFNIGSLSIGNNSSVSLRWTLNGNGGSSNGQGLAIDNFNMTAFYSAIIAGTYWAPAAGGGGTGIWSSENSNWATAADTPGTGPQATTGTLIFGNSAGTVTVSGTVSAVAGLQFSTDGYTVTGGTSVSLTGANAAANAITTDASVGATINTVLAGSAGMTKAGTGTLTLGGANTYTGGTAISGGRLVGSTTSLQGNITNNAALTFNQTTNGTFSSVVSGTGAVVKSGAGTLTLGGANTYTGGTTVSDGRLVGDTLSLQGNIANTAALTFSQTTNGTYGGVISGSGGTVTKSGTGTVTFTQNNTYTGATTVGAGRLVVNGSQGSSAVTVNSGASLAGSGTVGGLTVSGLLSPGNSIGTLSAGNTTFAADGAFQLEMFDWTGSAGTGWDLLDITGNLTISSTSLNPFTIDVVSFSDATSPGFSVNFNANQSFTNTFVTYSGSLTGFAANLFVVDASSFLNGTNGTFSITNVSGGLALLYTTAFDPGASYDWNAGSGNWSVAGNWAGNVAPVNDSLLLFTGAAGTATNNAAVTSVTGVIFSNTTGSIALAGDAFALGEGGIANNSANTHTISNNISLDANASILASSNGLTIAGNITNNTSSQTLTIGGSENTTISGAVSGQGDLSKLGLGTLTLSGANTFTGSFTINGGEAIVSGTAATTTIGVNVGGTLSLGAADALANGATVTVDAGAFNTATFNDTIGTLVLTNGGTVSGTGVLGATTFTLGGGTVSGALGAGTANVTGEVSLTGTMASTTINVNTGGTLTLGSADRIGGSTAVVIGGGTLAMGANNDTVGTFSITSGTLGGTGTLTAATYALGGGTISGNLGAGTATAATGTTTVDGNLGGTLTASGGTVDLNGTLADDLTVSGGTVNLGSADRLADTSDVSISSGTLGLGANNDTVGTFAITGGTLGGTGTLTAATYALNGGTIGANIGAGAATASSGGTTLNGTLDATTLSISGGTLVLGSPGRIGNATAVTLSSGQLDTATFSDSVGSFAMTGGTLAGTGQINSAAYDLQGGTINANLGTGTATVSTGTTELNGNLGGDLTASSGVANVGGTIAGNVTVSGGTVNVESADRIGNTSAVSVSSGTLDFAANDTVGAVQLTGGTITGAGTVTGASYDVQSGTISAALAGAGAMTKTGAGTTTLSANNSGYSGAVAVNDGAILASTSGALGSGAVTVTNGSTLAASGVTLANDFTIGSAAGMSAGTNVFIAGWDFQTTANGGTVIAAAPSTPTSILANFGNQAGAATMLLNGSNGSSTWITATSGNQLTAFGGTAINATNTFVSPSVTMSTTTSGAAALAVLGSSANGQSMVFSLNMSNIASLSLSYASQRTATGFNSQVWEYSSDASSWTAFWTNSAIASSFELESAPSALTALSNSATAYLRLTVSGGTGGNNRLDNILLNGVSVGSIVGASGSGTLGIE